MCFWFFLWLVVLGGMNEYDNGVWVFECCRCKNVVAGECGRERLPEALLLVLLLLVASCCC